MKTIRQYLFPHFPALLLWCLTLYQFFSIEQWPQKVALQFNTTGQPTRWGSSTEAFILFCLLPLCFIALSFFLDCAWMRTEHGKRFNWVSLLDEGVLGLNFGLTLSILANINSPGNGLEFTRILLITGAAILTGIIVECFRPGNNGAAPLPGDGGSITEAFLQKLSCNRNWTFFQTQNPPYLKLLIPTCTLMFAALSITLYTHSIVLSILMLCLAFFMLSLWGGIVVTLRNHVLRVHLGLWFFPLVRLKVADITSVTTESFYPLADYGGWGIRYGKGGTWAFFFCGPEGVKITTRTGRKFLIGSDHPQQLAQILQHLAGHSVEGSATVNQPSHPPLAATQSHNA